MKKLTLTLCGLAALSGCATLAPPEMRKAQYVENVKAPKATVYSKALAFFGKKFGDSNAAIKVQNQEAGQIVAQGNIQCLALRQRGDVLNDYNLSFSMDFEAKDNKFRLTFEDLVIKDTEGKPITLGYGQITNQEQADKAKTCLEPIRRELAQAIGSEKEAW